MQKNYYSYESSNQNIISRLTNMQRMLKLNTELLELNRHETNNFVIHLNLKIEFNTFFKLH